MVILQGLACLLLLLPALAFGTVWVRRALGSNDAHMCLALGAVAGLSAHITALNALSYLILPTHAGLLLCSLEAAGAWLLARGIQRREGACFNAAACTVAVRDVWPWVGLLALLWFWTCLQNGSSDQLFHACVSTPMMRSGLPITHPFDTAQVLNYHYGLNLLAASLGGLAGLKPWWALNVVMALLSPVLLACCIEFLRAAAARDGREATRAELLCGTLLFALGGNLTWVDALRGQADWHPLHRLGFGCDGIAALFTAPAHASAWVWLLGVLALALRWTNPRTAVAQDSDPWTSGLGRGLWSAAIPLGLMLGTVNLLAEHAALAIALALAVFAVWKLRRGFEGLSSLLLAGALGLGLALIQGGTVTGLALKLAGSGNLKPEPTGSPWPSFPSQLGRVSRGDAGYWAFSWKEYAHTLYLLPLYAAWAYAPRATTAARWILGATIPCAFVTLYVSFPLNEFDTYRFYQLYMSASMLASGLVLAWLWQRPSGPARMLRWAALAMCVALSFAGVRATLTQVLYSNPNLPWDFSPGQAAALQEVERRGQAHEGILLQIPNMFFEGLPPTPGILGRCVAASDPNTDATVVRGRAWMNALRCPSPPNLRTARVRWVCLSGTDLARALPILEGCPEYELIGAYGPEMPGERYRLYRYKGDWEAKDEVWWNIRKMEDLSPR